jgi:CheY-like chemotaxis protein
MPDRSATPSVLVVDDDKNLADSLVSILNKSGFVASAAYSGREAIQHAVMFPPDCILMDVFMEGIDGVDAAIAIRETIPLCGILLISGYEDARERLKKSTVRGHDFELLMKPIQPASLLRKLHSQHHCGGGQAA